MNQAMKRQGISYNKIVAENKLKNMLETQRIETIRDTINLIVGIMAISLNNEFGFSTKRINKLIRRMFLQLECIKSPDNELTRKDVEQWCKENDIYFS
jgi:hypothetical protein